MIKKLTLDEVQEHNDQLIAWLTELAEQDGIPLSLILQSWDSHMNYGWYWEDKLEGVIMAQIRPVSFNGKVFSISACAGTSFDRWDVLDAELAEIGREHGCDMIEMRGRPGFARVLKPYGYKTLLTVIGKEI